MTSPLGVGMLHHHRAGHFSAKKLANAARVPTTPGQNSGLTGSVSAGVSRTPAVPVLRAPSRVEAEEVLGPEGWVSGAEEEAFQLVLQHTGRGVERCQSGTWTTVLTRTTGGAHGNKYSKASRTRIAEELDKHLPPGFARFSCSPKRRRPDRVVNWLRNGVSARIDREDSGPATQRSV